jgi:hypothetical protein
MPAMKISRGMAVIILLLEIIALVTGLKLGNPCGSACPRDVLCPAVCTYIPHPLFYVALALLAITLFIFMLKAVRAGSKK